MIDEGVSKIMLKINEITGNNPGSDDNNSHIPLDYESRKYIHVKLRNIIEKYNEDGQLNRTIKSTDLHTC